MRIVISLAQSLVVALLIGCSPALEWRTLPLSDLALEVGLPCKPERAQRDVPLVGQTVKMTMQSCEAAGVTFAVACAALAQPSGAGAALAHWRAAVLAAAQAQDAKDEPFQPHGALGLPQSVRTRATGVLPQGGAMQLQAAWFARVRQSSVDVCHAMVYGSELPRALADVFFEALVLR
ncbi:MAG: hypothetical protein M9919_13845 [Burkholderiaceae bacterium]|nr:hypothetical protein [Burkholderiaceae bacterium]